MAMSYYDQYSSDPSLTQDAYGTFRRADGSAVMQSAENAQAAQAQRLAEQNARISTLNSIDGGSREQMGGFNYDNNAYFSGAQNFTPDASTAQYNTKPMTAPSGGGAPGGGSGGGGFSFGGGSSGGGGTGMASSSGQNPYLQQMGDVMAGQMTDNFNRKVMPGISSQMMATGGYGGSRQGVIEANAMNDLNGQIGGALTNLYGQGFNTALNYDLGLRGNDLGFAGLDAQINQNNFNNNLAGAQFGQGVWNQGMANNQTGITAGTNIQNTPQNYWSQFGNQFNSIGQGYGSTTGSSSQQGNPMMSMIGGAQLGGQLGNQFANWMGGSAGSAGDTATGQNFWAPNFSGRMSD